MTRKKAKQFADIIISKDWKTHHKDKSHPTWIEENKDHQSDEEKEEENNAKETITRITITTSPGNPGEKRNKVEN